MENKKKLVIPKLKWFFVLIVLGVLFLALGVMLLPVWKNTDIFFSSWSSQGVNIVLFAILLAYIIFVLGRNLLKVKSNFEKILSIFEIVLLLLIATGCMLQQFNVFALYGPCFVFGAILYLRGFISLLVPYFAKEFRIDKEAKGKAIISIGLITLGSIMMVIKIPGDLFAWFIALTILISAVVLILLGILTKPKSKKKEKN